LTRSRRVGFLLGDVITYLAGALARVIAGAGVVAGTGAVAGTGSPAGAWVDWRLTPAASTTGKTGKMHGEMLVIRPATKPIAIRTSMRTP